MKYDPECYNTRIRIRAIVRIRLLYEYYCILYSTIFVDPTAAYLSMYVHVRDVCIRVMYVCALCVCMMHVYDEDDLGIGEYTIILLFWYFEENNEFLVF